MKTRPAVLALAAACFAWGCAVTYRIPLTFRPEANPDLERLAPRRVRLEVTDERPADERDLVASKYLARWALEKPATETVAGALRAGLEAGGHSVVEAQEDVSLRVTLTRFYAVSVSRRGDVIKRAEMMGLAHAARAGGAGGPKEIPISASYERTYHLGAPGSVEEPLNDVLDKAMNQLLMDPRLLEVLSPAL